MRTIRIIRWAGTAALAVLILTAPALAARQAGPVPGSEGQPVAEGASVSGNTGQAAENDIRSQQEGTALPASGGGAASGLKGVMAVTLIIWIGLFAYVYRLDRKVRRLEGS